MAEQPSTDAVAVRVTPAHLRDAGGRVQLLGDRLTALAGDVAAALAPAVGALPGSGVPASAQSLSESCVRVLTAEAALLRVLGAGLRDAADAYDETERRAVPGRGARQAGR
jgi:hypothetical protein